MSDPKAAEKAYTTAEVAELKSVSIGFVVKCIKRTDAHNLPAKRIGKGFRIGAADLEAWWAGLADA